MDEGARWLDNWLRLRYPDPERTLAAVRLVPDLVLLETSTRDFWYVPDGGYWELELRAPDAWRMEYRFELHHPDGGTELVCDPENPLRATGGYGDRSVLRRPDYAEPGWLVQPAAPGSWRELSLPAPVLGAQIQARIWSPEPPTGRILVVHDGPEYDKLAELGQFSAAMVAAGR